MPIERVQHQGWLSRLGQSFAGIFIGLLLVAVAVVLQFWNEGRTLHQQRLLEQGRAMVVSVSVDRIDPANDGKLLHVVADTRSEGLREDPVFKQVAEGPALRRRVEMYQWRERSEQREETHVGGSKTTRTTYHYDKVWDDELIDSSGFEERSGHENPGAMPFGNEVWRAERVDLGAFELAPDIVAELGGWKPLAPRADDLPENLAASFSVDDGRLTTVNGSPRIGDVRISFERIPDGRVSVVAAQRGERLTALQLGEDPLLLVERGEHSAAQLFDAAERRNAGLGWGLRLAGFVVMWIGFALMLAPLGVLADVLPILGRATRFMTGMAAGVMAALVSFVAIASGWLLHRPWALLGLLLLVGAGVYALLRRKRQPAMASLAGMPPPPPPPRG